MAARKFWIGGNWKCNGVKTSNTELVEQLNQSKHSYNDVNVVVCPTPIHLVPVSQILNLEKYAVCAQNVGHQGLGAHTGEIALAQLQDAEIMWTLVGHSERRDGGESNELVGEKVKACQAMEKMNVCICFGEKLEDRESKNTMAVCQAQLVPCIEKVTDWSRVVLAYEPVWAIGTGKTATPEMAQATHSELRKFIADKVSPDVASKVRIVYGGSLNDKNADGLLSQPDIDGGLIGGAALVADKFTAVIAAASKLSK